MFTYSVTLKVAYFQSPKKALVISLPFFFKLFDQKCWDLLYQHKHPSKCLLPFEFK